MGMDGGILRERAAQFTKNAIEDLTRQRRLEEHKLELFNNFLNSL